VGAPNTLSAATARKLEAAERDGYWITARTAVDKEASELAAQRAADERRGVHRAILQRGDPHSRWLALTFDDGPHPEYTPRILAVLKQFRVPATFFVVGEMAERYPELVRAEVAAGHSVGNHTYHHVSLPKIPEEFVETEIQACGEVLQAITGRRPVLFRPPGGDYNDPVAGTAEALGYTIVLWTDDPGDFASPGTAVIERRTGAAASRGGILLLHDGVQETIDALPAILTRLQRAGYEFVTVDQMLGRASRGRVSKSES
jgi:peptidoglycan-N-acetylglucosamine deacetylase